MHTSALKNFTPSHPQHHYRHLHTHTHTHTHVHNHTNTHTKRTHTCVWPHTTHTHTHTQTHVCNHTKIATPQTHSTSQSPSTRACTVRAADFQTWFTTPWLWFHHNSPGSASSPHAVHILLNVSGEVVVQDVAAKSSIKIQQSQRASKQNRELVQSRGINNFKQRSFFNHWGTKPNKPFNMTQNASQVVLTVLQIILLINHNR